MSGVSQASSQHISLLVLITHSGLFCGSLWGASGLVVLGAVCNSSLGRTVRTSQYSEISYLTLKAIRRLLMFYSVRTLDGITVK